MPPKRRPSSGKIPVPEKASEQADTALTVVAHADACQAVAQQLSGMLRDAVDDVRQERKQMAVNSYDHTAFTLLMLAVGDSDQIIETLAKLKQLQ